MALYSQSKTFFSLTFYLNHGHVSLDLLKQVFFFRNFAFQVLIKLFKKA